MNAALLLERLRAHGVVVTVEGDQVRLKAPPGVLTTDMVSQVRKYKAQLHTLLPVYATKPPSDSASDGIVETLRRRLRDGMAQKARTDVVVRFWIYLKQLEFRTMLAARLPQRTRDARLAFIRSAIAQCKWARPDLLRCVSALHAERLRKMTRRRMGRRGGCSPKPLQPKTIERHKRLIAQIGLDAQFADGPVGAVLEAFSDQRPSLVAVRPADASHKPSVDNHEQDLRSALCDLWHRVYRELMADGAYKPCARRKAWSVIQRVAHRQPPSAGAGGKPNQKSAQES